MESSPASYDAPANGDEEAGSQQMNVQVEVGRSFSYRTLRHSGAGRSLPKCGLGQPPHMTNGEGEAQGGPPAHL